MNPSSRISNGLWATELVGFSQRAEIKQTEVNSSGFCCCFFLACPAVRREKNLSDLRLWISDNVSALFWVLCWIHGLKEFLHLKMIPNSAHGCAGSFFHPTDGPNNQVINCSVSKQAVGCCSWYKILLGSYVLNLLKWKDEIAPESSAVWGTVPKSFSVPSPSKYLRAVTGQGCLSKQSLTKVCRACSEMSDLFGLFLLGWQVQLKVIHILIISYVFLSSGFSCPQLKAINQRENTEELQQNSGGKGEVLGVGWWLLELSRTSQPGLSGFYFTAKAEKLQYCRKVSRNKDSLLLFSAKQDSAFWQIKTGQNVCCCNYIK